MEGSIVYGRELCRETTTLGEPLAREKPSSWLTSRSTFSARNYFKLFLRFLSEPPQKKDCRILNSTLDESR